jgi:hypothetical protein
MKKKHSLSAPPFRLIQIFEKNLIRHVPVLKNLKFSLQYLIIRKPLGDFEIEVHFILNTYRSYFLFTGKPFEIKRDLKLYSMNFSIEKIRFIFPNVALFKTKPRFHFDVPIQERISIEYFSELPESHLD